jgi:signal peptidase I
LELLRVRNEAKPGLSSKKGEELSLSRQGLEELLRSVLAKGVCCRFSVKGFSMSPFIRDGDVVTVSPLGSSALGLGDVVVFLSVRGGGPVIHRIVGKCDGSYLLKGDNLPELDGMVTPANILGYIKAVERKGKKISLGLGPERFLIALLTRTGLLSPMLLPFRIAAQLTSRGLRW